MKTITLYTIGFTQKSAETFFETMIDAGVKRLIDIRLNNTSQLAAFAKKDDLAYFLRRLGNIKYLHLPQFAPTQEIIDAFKKKKGGWEAFSKDFLTLMIRREAAKTVSRDLLHEACLLCSEAEPSRCHRSLVAAYLQEKWNGIEICHLGA